LLYNTIDIVIHPYAIIDCNTLIYQNVRIAALYGKKGANAVVLEDIPDNSTVVVILAKIINKCKLFLYKAINGCII